MKAIIVSGQADPKHLPKLVAALEKILDEGRKLRGFQHALMATQRDTGRFYTMTLFSSALSVAEITKTLTPEVTAEFEQLSYTWDAVVSVPIGQEPESPVFDVVVQTFGERRRPSRRPAAKRRM